MCHKKITNRAHEANKFAFVLILTTFVVNVHCTDQKDIASTSKNINKDADEAKDENVDDKSVVKGDFMSNANYLLAQIK